MVHYEEGKRLMTQIWGVPAEVIDVIPHGMDQIPVTMEKQQARARLNIDRDAQVMLFFGSIRDNKGLDVMIEAMANVVQAHPQALLVVAGMPKRDVDFDRYLRLIENSGVKERVQLFIRFIAQDEVDAFFAAADLPVMPYTKFEAQSGVLLRAYGHRLPVVVSNVGAMGESVQTDGVGLVVPPGDSSALSAAICSMLGDLDRYRARYGPDLVKKYSWPHIGQLALQTYERTLARRLAGADK
jgi:glycosyltransferase involved in cell wall biosynthesis